MVYEADDQGRFQAAGPPAGLAGEHTLASFSALLEGLAQLRRWGFEAPRSTWRCGRRGVPLHEVLGREPQPVRFVVSTGPQRIGHIREVHPDMRFKLDPTSEWDEALVQRLADSTRGRRRLQGDLHLAGREPLRRGRSLSLDRRCTARRADRGPGLNDPQKAEILEPHRGRITGDAPIHSVADVDALPFPPLTLNSKPSRFGSLRGLLDFYDTCSERGIASTGAASSSSGGRGGQIQYLASLFHPDAPNECRPPSEYNRPEWPRGFLAARCRQTRTRAAFRWLQA